MLRSSSSKRLKVGIVSFEYEGLTKNGGIGTAYRRLAELLVRDGHEVTLVFMPFVSPQNLRQRNSIAQKISKVRRTGVKVKYPAQKSLLIQLRYDSYHQSRSLLVLESIKSENFDIVHGPDNSGLLYFSILAKKAGIHFRNTNFLIGAHGSPFWAASANGEITAESVVLSQYDRVSLAFADCLVSPSKYMLDYLRASHWLLPKESYAFPNVNNFENKISRRNAFQNREKTIVFFGRLERRKGLFLFVEALLELFHQNPHLGSVRPVKVVFLGSELQSLGRVSPSEFVRGRTSHLRHRMNIEFFTKFSSEESNKYLTSGAPKLVCMPSLLDNSPYVIIEALEKRLDFISSNSGGQAELIDPRDHRAVLVDPDVQAFACAMKQRLAAAPFEARPSKQVLGANSWWSKFHQKWKKAPAKKRKFTRPKISVFFGFDGIHSDAILLRSLDSIYNQSYESIELLVNKEVSIREAIQAKFPAAKFVQNDLREAIQKARGKYLLFLDGAEFVHKDGLASYVRGIELHTESDRRLLGMSAAVDMSAGDAKRRDWSIPAPYFFDRIAAGHCLASVYAIWRRSHFQKVFRKRPSIFTHDLFLRPLVAEAFLQGYTMTTMPDCLLRSLTPEWMRLAQRPSDTSILEPLLSALPSSQRNILPALLGYSKDFEEYKNAFYREREMRLHGK